MNIRTALLAAAFSGFASSALCAVPASAEPAAGASEAGVWQKHQYQFRFMGFTSTYSCDGLADQLKRLLALSGARADAKSEPGACAASFGRPDKFANANLTFYTLAPAAAGATGDAAGTWKAVSIGAQRRPDLQPGDCELVEQFRDSVLKKMFTIRNVVDHMTCIPHQESGSNIDLRFEVFVAGPGAAAASGAAPNLFVYPKGGQGKEQQAKDRAECNAIAAAQSGFDPAQPSSAADAAKAQAYAAALTGCLEPRGYTVR